MPRGDANVILVYRPFCNVLPSLCVLSTNELPRLDIVVIGVKIVHEATTAAASTTAAAASTAAATATATTVPAHLSQHGQRPWIQLFHAQGSSQTESSSRQVVVLVILLLRKFAQ